MPELKYVILDCETTGNPESDDPIEIAYLFDLGQGATRSCTFHLKPTVEILPSAVVIHGITNEWASKYPEMHLELPIAMHELINNATNTSFVIVGHNVDYDIGVISNAIKKNLPGYSFNPQYKIDTIKLARKLIPQNKIGSYNLDAVYYYLFPTKLSELLKSRASHSALTDVKITNEVFVELCKRAEELEGRTLTLVDIIEFANRPMILTHWPFGKHKNKSIDDVIKNDYQYVTWFMTKADFKNEWPDLVYTLKVKL